MDGWRGDSRLSDEDRFCGGPSWSVAAEPGAFTLVELCAVLFGVHTCGRCEQWLYWAENEGGMEWDGTGRVCVDGRTVGDSYHTGVIWSYALFI